MLVWVDFDYFWTSVGEKICDYCFCGLVARIFDLFDRIQFFPLDPNWFLCFFSSQVVVL